MIQLIKVIKVTYHAHFINVDCCDNKRNHRCLANNFEQMMDRITVWDMIHKIMSMKKTDYTMTLFYSSPIFGGVKCGPVHDILTLIILLSTEYDRELNAPTYDNPRLCWWSMHTISR